jgi:hypothetical protein
MAKRVRATLRYQMRVRESLKREGGLKSAKWALIEQSEGQ